jgi:SAM-dependent methyltransferase
MEGYEASTYGERFADVYDDWYGEVTDAEACADRLAALAHGAGGGPVLELGVGSGRLALPLASRGLEVHGIDASPSMLERLRAKPGGSAVRTTLGDMAELALTDPPPFAVVFVAFNTFFNLVTEPAQRRCLDRVTALLAPAGHFVLEAFVPSEDVAVSARAAVSPRRITVDEVVLTASRVDVASQTVSGQHVHLRESGIRLRPWHLRYATPAQLDAMAAQAGLELESRTEGWRGEPFTGASTVHVSTYRRGNVRPVRDHPPAATR